MNTNTLPRFILSIDAERLGLHGPITAVGAVVYDLHRQHEVTSFCAQRTPTGHDIERAEEDDVRWYRANVEPALEATVKIDSWRGSEGKSEEWVVSRFAEWLRRADERTSLPVLVDHGIPVEADLLSQSREIIPTWQPYPIYDVATMQSLAAATGDPFEARKHLPAHHPVQDARDAIRLFLAGYVRMQDGAKKGAPPPVTEWQRFDGHGSGRVTDDEIRTMLLQTRSAIEYMTARESLYSIALSHAVATEQRLRQIARAREIELERVLVE